MSVSWNTVRAAVHAWIVRGSGLAAERVRWAGQPDMAKADTATGAYITLRIVAAPSVGQDGMKAERNLDDSITYHVYGARYALLSVQCFGPSTVGSGDPMAVLESVITARTLPSVANALRQANIGIGDLNGPTSVDGVSKGFDFEPRAVLNVGLHLTSLASEVGNAIETFEVDSTITGP